MKKTLAFVLAVLLVFALCACGQKTTTTPTDSTGTATAESKKYVIGYSQFLGSHPFVKTLTAGAQAACKEWQEMGYDVELVFTDAGSDGDFASQQVRDMEDLAIQNIDALLVFPGDSASVGAAIETVYNANDIPVVVTDIGVSSGEYISFLITDNYYAGNVAAEIMSEVLKPGDKVVAFNSAPGRENANDRCQGFMDKAKELGFVVLDMMPMETTVESGATNMEDLLVSTPDISGVFFVDLTPCTGAIGVIQDAGVDVKTVCFDMSATIYEMIKNGELTGSVVQDPYFMANEGFNQAMYYLTGQFDKVKKEIPSGSKGCSINNYEEFADDIQVSG